MKIVFLSNYLPYPPDNGVSLPIFNLLKGLKGRHEILYLYLNDGTNDNLKDKLVPFASGTLTIDEVSISKYSKAQRIFNELMLICPYFFGYDLSVINIPDKYKDADVYLFSPFTALAFNGYKYLSKSAIKVAWINDSTTAMMRSRIHYIGMKGISLSKKFYYVSQWLRSQYMGKLEAKSLFHSDLVFVQTDTERKWIDRISNGLLSNKVRVVTNGVNDNLFKIDTTTSKPIFIFFGDMSGIYNDLVIWLLSNVWPILKDSVPDATFRLIGKNASDEILNIVKGDPKIQYKSYIKNIEDVFHGGGVMLAPVYKDFGVINKVLESMAAGIPVVGDKTAFNGILGFKKDKHALVADTAEKMAECAKLLVEDSVLYESISLEARKLMLKDFSWQSRIDEVERNFEEVIIRRTNNS